MTLPVWGDDGDTFTAETVEGVMLTYTVISESEKTCMVGEVFIRPVPCSRTNSVNNVSGSQPSGDITIPEVANGYTVVRIEANAFNQAAITNVVIPNSVIAIGDCAFYGCVNLKSVKLSNQLIQIENETFAGCENLISIDIPEGVNSIGDYAFANCKQLKEVTIPSSVAYFGECVFWNTGFTSLPKLPESLTTIPNSMFYQCAQLVSVEIPQNITHIGECAFGRCPISEIEIPASVTHIGVAAFANCKNLSSIVIPNNVTDIGFNAFWGCSNLKTVTLSNNIISLNEGIFRECTSLESVTIPNGVKTIGKSAFEECSSLSSISIPETVEEIDERVFFGCSSLTQLMIPKSVVCIKNEEGWALLYACNSLTSIIIDENNPVYDSRNNSNAIIETANNIIIAGCPATTIPEGITTIGPYAFSGLENLTTITLPQSLNHIEGGAFHKLGLKEINIPENVTSIASYAFSNCKQLETVKTYIMEPFEIPQKAFYVSDSSITATLYVPQGTLEKYKSTNGWNVFSSIKENIESGIEVAYLPFVEEGKRWHVVRSDFDSGCHFETYVLMNEEIVKNGKTYMKMYRTEDILSVDYDAGLFREEGCKVYYYDSDMQKEYLMFDFSLKEGDTYETYSSDEQKMMTYKVLSVGDYTEGPEIVSYDYNQTADTIVTQHRYLRQWTVCREDNESIQKTWIEGVGSLEGPLANLYDERPVSSRNYLAYVEYNDFDYLPFSFYDEFHHIHGCDLPKGNAGNWDDLEDGWHHQLTFELEGDRLHVYGKALLMCGLYHYAYFTEEQTDDPLVRKLRFKMLGIVQPANCEDLFDTDFYVPGFDPNMNYIVLDIFGDEHPVINKTPQMAYRPFVEEDKVWKVGVEGSGNPVQWVEHYYFDGDTIIGGKTCKQMMSQRFVSPDYPEYDVISQQPSLSYVGAWYEEDQKVYFCKATNQQFKLMYDFSLDANDTLLIDNLSYVIGQKQTGGLKGFKGVYRNVWECGDGESIYWSTPWLEGVGGIFGPTINVIDGQLAEPASFLMACVVGDEVIYFNDEYEDGATPEGANARKRFDFTHTIKIQPTSRMRSRDNLSLYGEYNNLQLGINLDPLDDAYLVRITDDKGKAVYENAVNAGNIVGLNIDISTYAEGSYTVTVENSYESFTGIFETQTSGIEVVSNRNEEVRSIFYNLQGQRLSSLQKGLNIVNGQKVYVK